MGFKLPQLCILQAEEIVTVGTVPGSAAFTAQVLHATTCFASAPYPAQRLRGGDTAEALRCELPAASSAWTRASPATVKAAVAVCHF